MVDDKPGGTMAVLGPVPDVASYFKELAGSNADESPEDAADKAVAAILKEVKAARV